MKVNQIIQEYRRDVTLQNLGDRLLTRLGQEKLSTIPDEFDGANMLIHYAQDPESLGNGKRFSVVGQFPTVTPANVQEVLQQNRQAILDKILEYFEARDPTKTKTYVPWMLRSWINEPKGRMEDMNRGDLLSLYQAAKNRNVIRPEHKDINKFKTYGEFENTIRSSYSEEDLLSDAERKQREQAAKGAAKEVYEDPTVRVIQPEDEAAACYYGQGTQWCTAATRGNNMFNRYNQNGPMYILIPKNPEYEGEKYQIHLASAQFMDEQDSPVYMETLMGRFPGFFKELKTLDPENADDIVAFADTKTLKRLADQIMEMAEEKMWDTIYDWESQDDYWDQYRAEEAKKRGYVDDNGDIDWDRVHEDDDLNDYTEYNDDAAYFVRDVDRVRKMSGDDWQQWIIDVQNEHDQEGLAKVSDFEYAVAHALDEESDGSAMYNLANWIRTKLKISKDGGEWQVKRMPAD